MYKYQLIHVLLLFSITLQAKNLDSSFVQINCKNCNLEIYEYPSLSLLDSTNRNEYYFNNYNKIRTLLFMNEDNKHFTLILNKDSLNVEIDEMFNLKINEKLNQEYNDLIKELKQEELDYKHRMYYNWYMDHPDLISGLNFLYESTNHSTFSKDSLILFFNNIDSTFIDNEMYKHVKKSLFEKSKFSINTNFINVYHGYDSIQINKESVNKLNSILNLIDLERIEKTTINCYCDSIGSKIYNLSLSKKRCLFLKEYLLKKHHIDVETFANGESYSYSTPEQNRYSKIEFTYKTDNKPLNKNRTILDQVQFKPGSTDLLETSYTQLAEILNLVKQTNSDYEIYGHVCCSIDKYGIALSKNRAKVIYTYLIENGINSNRLSYVGYGGDFPLNGNLMDPKNRRVELIEVTKN